MSNPYHHYPKRWSLFWFFQMVLLLNTTSSCALPVSDPFEIIYNKHDQVNSQRFDDLRFTNRKAIYLDVKKHHLNRLSYRRLYGKDYDEYATRDPYADLYYLPEWDNAFEEWDGKKSSKNSNGPPSNTGPQVSSKTTVEEDESETDATPNAEEDEDLDEE